VPFAPARVAGGGGCRSARSSAGSRHAQVGALLHQMFIDGRTEDGSFNDPARTAVSSGLADEFANSGDPHLGQNRCRILLPLSAVLSNSLICPETSIAAVGTIKFTMPLADVCWQSRHQQTLVANGSAERRKRTAPQRQCPALSVMDQPSESRTCNEFFTSFTPPTFLASSVARERASSESTEPLSCTVPLKVSTLIW
jgi:hypothetical protein